MAGSLALVRLDAPSEDGQVGVLEIVRGFVEYFDGTGPLEVRAQTVTKLLSDARLFLKNNDKYRGLTLQG